ncbi:hypothetical protein Tco_0463086 [Tanacetum coccineum]
MLTSKWTTLNHHCQKFNAIYKRCHRLKKSGESEVDLMGRARGMYQDENRNSPFNHEKAWAILRQHAKWDAPEVAPVDLTEDETGDFHATVNTDELFGADPRPRPPGKQRPGKKPKSDTRRAPGEVTRPNSSSGISRCLHQEEIAYTNTVDSPPEATIRKRIRELELTGNEEHPPNGDIIYDYPPAYDEYEDEEWYSWMTGAGVTYDPTGVKLQDSPPRFILKELFFNQIGLVDCGPQDQMGRKDYEGPTTTSLDVLKSLSSKIATTKCVGAELFERFNLIANSDRFNAPYDPGGTGLVPGETTREVKLFRRDVTIINESELLLPFDPGDFAPKAKLEDEFFRRGGE